jgi:hypothetical protein
MDVVERLKIPVVAESEMAPGFHEVSVPLSLRHEVGLITSMWSSLKPCWAVATVQIAISLPYLTS